MQALAAVLGGAQSLHTNGADEALGLPSQTSARTALRTQQILAFESGVADVADPLGGAVAIEALTSSVELEARKILERVEAMGGAIRAVEEGYPQAAIEDEAYRHQREVESRERIVVGVNTFRDESAEKASLAPQRVDVRGEEERIGALRRRKGSRPGGTIASLVALLKQGAKEGKNLMEALVPCAEGGVTIGEMMGALVEVFGEHLE